MYLQITTRCNMSCAHCCFSASRHGQDMSRDVLVAALKLAADFDSPLVLGGGEPTVHPHFWDYLGLALAYDSAAICPMVITNGKRKDIALSLARLAERGVIAAELSQDDFHDPISAEVVAAFTPSRRRGYDSVDGGDNDLRGIRAVQSILPVGRALDENVATESAGCCCDDLLVSPDGTIWACGCKTISLGTVFAPEIPSDWTSEWAHDAERLEQLALAA